MESFVRILSITPDSGFGSATLVRNV